MEQTYQSLPAHRGALALRMPSRAVFYVVEMGIESLLYQSLAGGHPKNSMTLAPKLRQTLKELTAGSCQLTTLHSWTVGSFSIGVLSSVS